MNKLLLITNEEFENYQPALKVISHECARKFASLRISQKIKIALSWRSDLVVPVILEDSFSNVWVGVDQRVASISRQGIILFSMGLGSALLDIKQLSKIIVVLCETELFTINQDFSIRRLHYLRDLPDSIASKGDDLIVTFIDASDERIPLQFRCNVVMSKLE
ncbi:MAG: hypothetical protein LBM75_10660 [Myxococcales bacterium]|jgi:hypothetical protein|nr:hypothetical protein [Myxococcales bacterium]